MRFDPDNLDDVDNLKVGLELALSDRNSKAFHIIAKRLDQLEGRTSPARPTGPARVTSGTPARSGGGSLLPDLQRIRGMIADAQRTASEIDQAKIRDFLRHGPTPKRARPRLVGEQALWTAEDWLCADEMELHFGVMD